MATEAAEQRVLAMLDRLKTCYSGSVMGKLKLVRVGLENVGYDEEEGALVPEKGKAKATVVLDLDVDESMCNPNGAMHGGCTATLLDVVSSAPLFALGSEKGWSTSGVSQNFNINFLAPILDGSQIRITSTNISFGSRSAVTDCDFTDRKTGRLLACGHHNKVDPFQASRKSKL